MCAAVALTAVRNCKQKNTWSIICGGLSHTRRRTHPQMTTGVQVRPSHRCMYTDIYRHYHAQKNVWHTFKHTCTPTCPWICARHPPTTQKKA